MDRTSSDWFAPSPYSETRSWTGLPAFIPATRSATRASVSPVKTVPLMTAEGSWSFIPMQDVSYRPIAPSGDVSPKRHPTSFSKASATAARPRMKEVIVLLR